jgi:D-alanyl-D-alanine carboxypeptidase (penicillin-binding protein 5/6)
VKLRSFPFRLLVGLVLLAMTVMIATGSLVREATQAETELFAPPVVADPTITVDAPVVAAVAYVVMDGDTGQVLASANADQRRPVGSLVKLMTARLALAAGDPDHPVTMPDVAVGGDESQLGLVPGEVQSRGDLIDATLVASANDAARALAVDVGGDEATFVAMMNDEAAALGLDDTRYANPVGLDDGDQWSSAADVARLSATLMEDQRFRAIVAAPDVIVGPHHEATTNDLLGSYLGVDGVKSGHTDDAGWCLAASATRDGRRVVAVVLGSPTEHDRDASAVTLLEWGFGVTQGAREG